MPHSTCLQDRSSKIFGRLVAALFVLIVLSCGKTGVGDVAPQSLLTEEQYSLEVAKALYSAIQLNNHNLKITRESFVADVAEHKNDIIRNSANSLFNNERFQNLFVNSSVPNARSLAGSVETLNLDAIGKEINSSAVSADVRKGLLQYSRRLEKLKNDLHKDNVTDPDIIKQKIGEQIAEFEDDVKKDKKLSSGDKSIIFSFTIPSYDNLNNIKDLLTKTNRNGRMGCFFCKIVNIFVTVVVAAAIVAVAAVVVIAIVSALAAVAIASSAYAAAGLVGAAMGILLGSGYAIDDTCLLISDYNQNIYEDNAFLGFTSAEC